MHVFRLILFSAVIAGGLVGLAVTAVEHLGTVPLILKAEVYERASEASSSQPVTSAEHAQHQHGQDQHAQHQHSEEAWTPQDGLERTAFTAVANILTAIGFGLVLCGIFAVRGPGDWYEGLLWGLAGFVVFTVAPGLGLPPTLPGIPAADLEARQIWWIATAASTAGGLALLFFRRSPLTAIIALCLLALPHVIGSPQPDDAHTNVPQALSRQFVAAVTFTSLFFWSLLGSLTSIAYRRLSTAE
jgi:cobalt transporter subunit CbtA